MRILSKFIIRFIGFLECICGLSYMCAFWVGVLQSMCAMLDKEFLDDVILSLSIFAISYILSVCFGEVSKKLKKNYFKKFSSKYKLVILLKDLNNIARYICQSTIVIQNRKVQFIYTNEFYTRKETLSIMSNGLDLAKELKEYQKEILIGVIKKDYRHIKLDSAEKLKLDNITEQVRDELEQVTSNSIEKSID